MLHDYRDPKIEDLSMDEIDKMFQDIIEMPAPIIAGVANPMGVCLPKGGVFYTQ